MFYVKKFCVKKNFHHISIKKLRVITFFLEEKFIHSTDIDPIYRHLPASQRPKYQNRHSAFQVQIALLFLNAGVEI